MQAGHYLCIRLVHLMLCATQINRFAVSKLHTVQSQCKDANTRKQMQIEKSRINSNKKFVRRAQ